MKEWNFIKLCSSMDWGFPYTIDKYIVNLISNGIKIKIIGDIKALPEKVQEKLFYSIFCTCSLIFSILDFKAITSLLTVTSTAFTPKVLISRFNS